MRSLVLGLALAVGASVALSASYLLQHAGSGSAVAVSARRPLATLRSLLGSPAWTLGAAVGLAGWAMHIDALAHAPLSLVQAFVAGGLALTVPIAAIGLGHRARPQEKHATLVMVVALILLSVGLRAHGARERPDAVVLGAYLTALAGTAGVLVALPHVALPREQDRPAALALAGGLLYGAADLTIKALTGMTTAAAATSPWLAAAALTTIGAFFAFQRALQAGRPVTVIALMTAATNVASIAGGFAVFGDQLGRTPTQVTAHALGFALVGLAAWRLAPSQAAVAAR
jgi:hypothetical protein